MHFSQIFALFSSAVLVAAAPAPIPVGVDDVILYSRDGRFQIMKRDDLDELKKLRESGVAPPRPSYLDENLIPISLNETSSPGSSIKKRDSKSLIIPNPPSRFLGWDVQTSQVVKGAAGATKITISVGYSIADSLSVSQSAQITLVKDFFQATTTLSYSQTWTTTQTQMFAADVPEGKYGAFVTNAWTNRQSGNVWEGTVGGDGTLSYYQGDSFDEKAYGDLKWVDGVISLCTGDSFPLKRCLGEGTL